MAAVNYTHMEKPRRLESFRKCGRQASELEKQSFEGPV